MRDADSPTDRLYELMPALYRERDAERGYPLRALLDIIQSQVDLVERDIGQLWDDFFIETCRPWVTPYIGDLVSNRLLFDSSRTQAAATAERLFPDLTGPSLRPPFAVRTRADVAKTVYYRRRKSTLPMLEELARDVTGWPAHAVEFFELLAWTQHLDHVRFQSQSADIRNFDRMDRVDSAFDEVSHTVDIRRITQDEGWHNIPNVGFFLFRLASYQLKKVPARRAAEDWQYHFSPLGNRAPLFIRGKREADETGLATELHIPAPIRRAFFYEDLQRYRKRKPVRPDFTDLYGSKTAQLTSLGVARNGVFVNPTLNPAALPENFQPQIVCRLLDPWPATQPPGHVIAIDPRSGRIAVGDGWQGPTESIDVDFHYGFPGNLGGGPYERHDWLMKPQLAAVHLFVNEAAPTPDTFASVEDALADWVNRGRPNTLITIQDSRSYDLPATITLPNQGFLVIEAASGERPLLQTSAAGLVIDTIPPAGPNDPTREAALTLSGVLCEGHLRVVGDLGKLRLLHSTLVPGRRLTEDGTPATTLPSIVVEPELAGSTINSELSIEIAFSIVGPLSVPEHARSVHLLDSIADGFGAVAYSDAASRPGANLHLERSTIFGRVLARSLNMSESVATGIIYARRKQDGCVRFSYVRPKSQTPRRYRCQPELALAAEIARREKLAPLTPAQRDQIGNQIRVRVVPLFTSVHYGEPAYGQLHIKCSCAIQNGAEDGAEMGAYCCLKQPQRETNLHIRLEEYFPVRLEPGIIYTT